MNLFPKRRKTCINFMPKEKKICFALIQCKKKFRINANNKKNVLRYLNAKEEKFRVKFCQKEKKIKFCQSSHTWSLHVFIRRQSERKNK